MTTADTADVVSQGAGVEAREARLAEGAQALRARGAGGLFGRDRILITLAATLMFLGLCAVLLGWVGAAHATILEEQVPYLISGGLLGVALAVIGALCLLAHWLTVLVRESRQQHAELTNALHAIAARLDQQEVTSNGRARSSQSQRPVRRQPRSK